MAFVFVKTIAKYSVIFRPKKIYFISNGYAEELFLHSNLIVTLTMNKIIHQSKDLNKNASLILTFQCLET